MRRSLVLLRSYLAGREASDSYLAALLLPAVSSSAFALLVRDELTSFAYALVFLTLATPFVAIPLLGELGYLLRRDTSFEWVGALPLTEREIRAARALHLVAALCVLVSGPLLPAALLAPADMGIVQRLVLVVSGFGLALVLAALLLLLQGLLAGRAESLFVLLQTGLVAGVFIGIVLGARHIASLAHLRELDDSSPLALLPSAWFARPFGSTGGIGLPLGCTTLALVMVLFLPRPNAPQPSRRLGLAERFLVPARALASRLWLRADERAPFDLVYDALPREREVVLRTYPMIGIPLAFLVAASTGENPAQREGLLALLLFTPSLYLPILLSHVCVSESAEARWILGSAPVAAGAIANGAVKALAVRFLLPLYAVLFVLAWHGAGLVFALRLAVPGALLSLLVLRRLYAGFATDLPLSVLPERVRARLDAGGNLLVLAVGLTVLSILAYLLLGLGLALLLSLALLLVEVWAGRALRHQLG